MFKHNISIISRMGMARHGLSEANSNFKELVEQIKEDGDPTAKVIVLSKLISGLLIASSELLAISDHPDLTVMFSID